MTPSRIYLDNAATSWPKPEAVYQAVDDYQRRLGAPAGRAAYREAQDAERIVASCRQQLAALLGVDDPASIVFTLNGTDGLNTAIMGLVRPGDHVVTSVCEHNSVLRPLRLLADERDVSASYVACDGAGRIDPDEVRRAITPRTRLIVLIHASNVTGAVQPLADVGRIAAERGIPFLVDAAQSLGYLPVDVRTLGCQLLAAPGHKGLLGPLGTGALYIARELAGQLAPLRLGGTGTRSDEERQPDGLPEKFEAGNLNLPGIAGLDAGLRYVAAAGVEATRQHLESLLAPLLAGLAAIPGVRVYGPDQPAGRGAVISLNLAGWDPQELASLLDVQWSIQTRAGLHCAPRMHAALQTAPRGTLRVSLGHFTTRDEIDALLAALADIAAG